MDYKDIESLLDKYWACETSLEEKHRLKVFFQKGDFPEHMKPYADMFNYYKHIREKNNIGKKN